MKRISLKHSVKRTSGFHVFNPFPSTVVAIPWNFVYRIGIRSSLFGSMGMMNLFSGYIITL